MKAILLGGAGLVLLAGGWLLTDTGRGAAQQPTKPAAPTRASQAGEPPHAEHGTPEGWTFRWPKGDAARGRQVFVKLECYSCHEVKGEKFPAPSDPGKIGPELSQMGPLHEAEYFAEAIINPGAVIEKGKGYQAADGSSKMPSFNDSVTVQEVVDLVAFLRGLKTAPAAGGHRGH
jgi:mono/diheme cytochrome c family protein